MVKIVNGMIKGYLVNEKGIPIHRVVSEQSDGPIPSGWHVHHCDFNKHNNTRSNLVQIPEKLHSLIHKNSSPLSPPTKKYITESLLPDFLKTITQGTTSDPRKDSADIEFAIMTIRKYLLRLSPKKRSLEARKIVSRLCRF